ncbi:MAG: hypothetical protein R3C28_28380 [Pirellulaceae bacterium]
MTISGDKGRDVIWGGLPTDAVAAWGIGTNAFSVASPPEWIGENGIEDTFDWLIQPSSNNGFETFVTPELFDVVNNSNNDDRRGGRDAYDQPTVLVVPKVLLSRSVDGVKRYCIERWRW